MSSPYNRKNQSKEGDQKMTKYTAKVGGASWTNGPQCSVSTIAEGREFGESYGTTADWCQVINNSTGRTALFQRDQNGNGTRWYRGETTSGAE